MKEMEHADASDVTFLALAQRLEDQLRHHASDEEDDQFPKLRTDIPRGQAGRDRPAGRGRHC